MNAFIPDTYAVKKHKEAENGKTQMADLLGQNSSIQLVICVRWEAANRKGNRKGSQVEYLYLV